MRVLIAEDDVRVAELLKSRLKADHVAADICHDGREAVSLARAVRYDVIVLDVMMPEMDGLDAVRLMRERGVTSPVLFLTARDAIEDRVKGLNAGADDYLVKPFAYEELLARVFALTRRLSPIQTTISVGGLTLDTAGRSATRDGERLPLTSREFSMLEYLARNAGVVLTRDQILENVWSMDYEGVSNMVDVYIRSLRKKVDGGRRPGLIRTVRGVGYVLRGEEEA